MMPQVVSEKKRTLIFVNLILSSTATSMLVTALTTALPAVVNDLQISFALGQWLTSGYSLIMGVMMPLTAFLVTRFPTKNLYLTGLGISVFGLIFCALAPNFPIMMLARGLHACGNGMIASMAQVILLTIYPLEQRGSAMGWYGMSVGVAPVVAPFLAGLIVDTLGWRAIFYLALAIMIPAFLWAMRWFDNVLETEKKKFDAGSFVISAIALGGITLGVGNLSNYGIASVQTWPLLAGGIIAAALFVRRQLHIDKPFLEMRVFKDKNYTLSVIGSGLIYFVMMGRTMLLALYMQSICGYSATISGLVMVPGSIAMAITSPFAGKIYDKIGIKKLFVVGALCLLGGGVAMAFIGTNTPVLLVALFNAICNVSIGCLMMPLVTWGTRGLSNSLTAHGSALLMSLRTVSGAIGTAVFVGIMTTVTALSGSAYGTNASLRGFGIASLSMAVFTSLLLVIAIFFVKAPSRERKLTGREGL